MINKLSYLAGFFDGEGCRQVYKTKPTYRNPYGQHRLQVTVAQSQKGGDVLSLFTQLGGSIYHRKDGNYTWQINGREAGNFLEILYPYFIIKAEQAKIAIKFQRLLGNGGKGKGIALTTIEYEQREKARLSFREAFRAGAGVGDTGSQTDNIKGPGSDPPQPSQVGH